MNGRKQLAILGSLLLTLASSQLVAQQAVTVTSSQRVHPVLIRNPESRLLTIEIQCSKDNVQLKEITFDLSGSDDIADLDFIKMEIQGSDNNLAGPLVTGPQQVFTFEDHTLAKGTTTIWLNCGLKPTANLLHKVDASCSRVITSAGEARITDSTPDVRKRIGYALRRHMDDQELHQVHKLFEQKLTDKHVQWTTTYLHLTATAP